MPIRRRQRCRAANPRTTCSVRFRHCRRSPPPRQNRGPPCRTSSSHWQSHGRPIRRFRATCQPRAAPVGRHPRRYRRSRERFQTRLGRWRRSPPSSPLPLRRPRHPHCRRFHQKTPDRSQNHRVRQSPRIRHRPWPCWSHRRPGPPSPTQLPRHHRPVHRRADCRRRRPSRSGRCCRSSKPLRRDKVPGLIDWPSAKMRGRRIGGTDIVRVDGTCRNHLARREKCRTLPAGGGGDQPNNVQQPCQPKPARHRHAVTCTNVQACR